MTLADAILTAKRQASRRDDGAAYVYLTDDGYQVAAMAWDELEEDVQRNVIFVVKVGDTGEVAYLNISATNQA